MGQLFSAEEEEGEKEPAASWVELRDEKAQSVWEVTVPFGTQIAQTVRVAANEQHPALQALGWEYTDAYSADALLPETCTIHVDDGTDAR